MPFVIGFCGANAEDNFEAYHVAARHVIETGLWTNPLTVAGLSFESPLMLATQEIYRLTGDQTFDYTKKDEVDPRWQLTPRQMMKQVGNAMRAVDKDLFVKNMKLRLAELNEKEIVFVYDMFFDNEAALVKEEYKGVIIQIGRLDETSEQPEQTILQSSIDATVDNDGNPDTFRHNVTNAIDLFASKFRSCC